MATRNRKTARARQVRQRAGNQPAREPEVPVLADIPENRSIAAISPYQRPHDQVMEYLKALMADMFREVIRATRGVPSSPRDRNPDRQPPALRGATLTRPPSPPRYADPWELRLYFEFDICRVRQVPGTFARELHMLQREPRRLLAQAEAIYSQMLENSYIENRLREARMAVEMSTLCAHSPEITANLRERVAALEEHYRRHHQGWAPDASPMTATATEVRARQERALTTQDLIEAARRLAGISETAARRLDQASLWRGWQQQADVVVGHVDAQRKGMALLKAHLTEQQRQDLEKHNHFEVRGGESGKTYRIKFGRQMNIHELDAQGNVVTGWCFVPQGFLVEGDCMLAQKTALELCESKALGVANRFTPGVLALWLG